MLPYCQSTPYRHASIIFFWEMYFISTIKGMICHFPTNVISICFTRFRKLRESDIVKLYNALYHIVTSSNGNIFRVTGHLCGEFTGPRWIPPPRPVTRSFDVYFDLRPNKRLSKQLWGWWFETLSCPLWRHCNAVVYFFLINLTPDILRVHELVFTQIELSNINAIAMNWKI